jgi:hypothetical protein
MAAEHLGAWKNARPVSVPQAKRVHFAAARFHEQMRDCSAPSRRRATAVESGRHPRG